MSVIPFTSPEFDLTVAFSGDSFTVQAPQLAKALGFREAYDMLRSIPEEEKGSELVRTPGGTQRVGFLTEVGFYRVLGQRQAARINDREIRAKVERFQAWVYSEVLPSIRKRGGYLTLEAAEKALADPDFIIRLATDLKAERAARAQLEAQAEADRPKVLFADSVSASHSTVLVGEVAKILKGNGVDIGGTRLFELLRRRGLLISREGSDWNMPTQKAMELGLFQIKETAITHSDGHVSISKTTKVTGKGQQYIVQRVLSGAWNDSIAIPKTP